MEFVPLGEGLVPRVARLINRCLEYEAVTPWTVNRCTILDPNFDPEATIVALDQSEPVGIILGAQRIRAPPELVGREHGWIKLAVVEPRYMQSGLMDQLLLAIERSLKSKGAKDVRVSDFAGWMFWPGVDLRYPDLLRFFGDHGYLKVNVSVEYEVNLLGMRAPSFILEKEAAMAEQGYAFTIPDQEQREGVIDWIHSNFGPLYSHEASEAFRHDIPSLWLAYKGDEIVGFSSYGTSELNWFGPIGVIESERRKGVGSVLLYKALMGMKEEGRRIALISCHPHLFFSQIPSIRSVRDYLILSKRL